MIVSISANIGVGKSTLLGGLCGCTVLEEQVEEWSYLEQFYRNPKVALQLQLEILLSRYQQLKGARPNEGEHTVIERSTLDSLFIFARHARDHGNMTQQDYALLAEYTAVFGSFPDLVIYMRCDPKVAYERIKQRSRNCETGISMKYLKEIHDLHEKYFSSPICAAVTIDVSNMRPYEVLAEVQRVLESKQSNRGQV